jgi:hypothetical protein
MLPGHDVEGDGIVLELHGLIVNLLSPDAESRLHGGDEIEVRAGVKLLCTCPIYEGSLWEAADYSVMAELWSGGERLRQVELKISDAQNVFTGRLKLPEVEDGGALSAELRVVAANDKTHNYGIDRSVYKISP